MNRKRRNELSVIQKDLSSLGVLTWTKEPTVCDWTLISVLGNVEESCYKLKLDKQSVK